MSANSSFKIVLGFVFGALIGGAAVHIYDKRKMLRQNDEIIKKEIEETRKHYQSKYEAESKDKIEMTPVEAEESDFFEEAKEAITSYSAGKAELKTEPEPEKTSAGWGGTVDVDYLGRTEKVPRFTRITKESYYNPSDETYAESEYVDVIYHSISNTFENTTSRMPYEEAKSDVGGDETIHILMNMNEDDTLYLSDNEFGYLYAISRKDDEWTED